MAQQLIIIKKVRWERNLIFYLMTSLKDDDADEEEADTSVG
jgi:hypothetical protein